MKGGANPMPQTHGSVQSLAATPTKLVALWPSRFLRTDLI